MRKSAGADGITEAPKRGGTRSCSWLCSSASALTIRVKWGDGDDTTTTDYSHATGNAARRHNASKRGRSITRRWRGMS